MKIPAFKPSGKILGRYDAPCLRATGKKSEMPRLGGRYPTQVKNDRSCRIYLRRKKSKTVNAWQREMLEQFFEKEQLAPIIAKAMAGYEKKAGKRAYMFDEKERNDFNEHGIPPFMTVSTIVIDGIE